MSGEATAKRERAFEEFAAALTERFGARVHEVILYGSTARGEATEHSDVDVLVVLDRTDDTEELFQLSFDIGLEHGVPITPHLQTRAHFEEREDWPFLRNVRSEGRSYGRVRRTGDAASALSDARKLREAGGTDGAVINRLYYACFHAAQALLHTRGHDPTTRGGVLMLFGQEIVATGEATRDDGRFFNEMQSYGLAADYEDSQIDVDVSKRLERTETFVHPNADRITSFR